jgi:shikimate dehydrogenase
MDRYAVAGNPVEHSQSPFIHAEFARQTGQLMEYTRLLCPRDSFAQTLRSFVRSDGGGTARGCNVTVPFKFEAFELAPRHTDRAALARAANVLRFDPEGWLADNTDGVGLVRDIERNTGMPLAGKRVLLIGAGGAAAGVLGPLLGARPAQIVLANRTTARAEELVARHLGAAGACQLLPRGLDDCGVGFDVVVNATTSSLEGAAPPVNARVLAPGALALDMMYGAPAQAFVAWANLHGARGRDGLGMLVEQAAQAFEMWRGVRPDTAPVLAALRARLSGARA